MKKIEYIKYSECLCSELIFTKKKWKCLAIFFGTTDKISMQSNTENLLNIGQFNIDMKIKSLGYDKIDKF